MSEVLELDNLNKNDEQRSLLNDAKMFDESLINKLNKNYIFRCRWCGTEKPEKELIVVNGITLCQTCNKVLEKK